MNAGPAPTIGDLSAPGAPPAFIAQASAGTGIGAMAQGSTTGPDLAAGAAPDSGAQTETYTSPEPGGEDNG